MSIQFEKFVHPNPRAEFNKLHGFGSFHPTSEQLFQQAAKAGPKSSISFIKAARKAPDKRLNVVSTDRLLGLSRRKSLQDDLLKGGSLVPHAISIAPPTFVPGWSTDAMSRRKRLDQNGAIVAASLVVNRR
jgi:hypothetical protein